MAKGQRRGVKLCTLLHDYLNVCVFRKLQVFFVANVAELCVCEALFPLPLSTKVVCVFKKQQSTKCGVCAFSLPR